VTKLFLKKGRLIAKSIKVCFSSHGFTRCPPNDEAKKAKIRHQHDQKLVAAHLDYVSSDNLEAHVGYYERNRR
jgi:hypothetical protein